MTQIFWHHFNVSGVTTWIWLPPLAAFVISFFTSMVGISGAFLLVPFQMSVLGFASPSASATNLVFNLLSIPGGMYRYRKERRLCWRLALLINAGGAPGTLAGAWLRTHWLNERAVFEPFVATVLAYLAWRMLKDVRRSGRTAAPVAGTVQAGAWTRGSLHFNHGETRYTVGGPSLLGLSFIVGVIGTAYGIGGGSFMVPLCVAVYGLPVHAVAGATLTATFLTSAIALAAYSWMPAPAGVVARPDWALGLAFGLGGLAGVYLGARQQRRIPQRTLKIGLALLLIGLALRYAWPG